MTYDEWKPIYAKMVKGRDRRPLGEQCQSYFEVLSHFSGGVIETAILRWNVLNRAFPQASDIREMAVGVLASAPKYVPPVCPCCHGDGFVDAPDQEHMGRMYPNYVRCCPQCRQVRHQASTAYDGPEAA